MKAVATEVILTVGVLIAAGFALLQLRGVFFAQQELGKKEIVQAFAEDLEAIVDKAIATTGDAAFLYYPNLKKYKVEVKDNVFSILDKVSGKTSTFSKSVPKVADNSFEDCEKIFVVKVKEEIAVYCKCLELGEDCSSSLLCCSGYCNDTVKKCDMPPICPQQLRCPGAPTGGGKGDNAWIDFNGVVCCPLENIGDDSGPVCSNKHCCPTHKPKWCGKPIKGEPRCMSEDEFENECEKKATFVILFIQLNQKISNFKEKAESAKDFWVELTPLKNCPQNVEAVVVEDKVCDVPSDQSSLCRCFETQNPYYCSLAESIFKTTMNNIEKCARSWGFDGKYVRVEGVLPGTYICKSGGGGILGYTNLYETRLVSSEAGILSTTSHEMGHTYGLCDEGYGGGYCSGCASGYCASSGTDICVGDGYCCPNKPEYNSIMCSSNKCGTRCSPGSRFASTSYAHLEKELSKYCS